MTATLGQLPNVGDKIQIVYRRKDNLLTDTSGIFQGVSKTEPDAWIIQIERYNWTINKIITWQPVLT